MEEVFEVYIKKFNDVELTGLGYRYEVDVKSLKRVICIKDNTDMVNIDTGEKYHIIDRKQNGVIKETEFLYLNLDEYFVTSYKNVDLLENTIRSILKMQSKAIKMRKSLNNTAKQLKKTK